MPKDTLDFSSHTPMMQQYQGDSAQLRAASAMQLAAV